MHTLFSTRFVHLIARPTSELFSKSSRHCRQLTMASLPKIQKAIFQPDKMSTDVVMINDHPVPNINKDLGEHLIQVKATAITNGELLWTKNFPPPAHLVVNKVLVPCNDVAGVVVDGPASSPFQPGAEVYARSNYVRTGCAREYSVLVTEEMAERPKSLSWAESAAVPMSAETAWQALFVHAGVEARSGSADGLKVLVTAASGGVGVWMTQLAKWAGAEVIATCGPRNIDSVKVLGADEVLDYTKTSVKEWSQKGGNQVDIVLDCVGGAALADSWWAAKEGATVIGIFQPPSSTRPDELREKNVKNLFFIMASNGTQLKQVTELIEHGSMRPSVDSVFPFADFQQAFSKVKSGKASGKVVLEVAHQ